MAETFAEFVTKAAEDTVNGGSGSWPRSRFVVNPRPSKTPDRVLLDLCGYLYAAIDDMAPLIESGALDRAEALLKLDGIALEVREARRDYLDAVLGTARPGPSRIEERSTHDVHRPTDESRRADP